MNCTYHTVWGPHLVKGERDDDPVSACSTRFLHISFIPVIIVEISPLET